jgi:hypothetical protein
MSTVPSGTRFIGISERVNLKEKKSTILNSETQPFTIQDIADTVGVGSQGPQGIQGPAGPLGPVGPAGLNWQGSWVSGTSYIADDAVGYNGASYFCILATSGTTTPNLATTNWALLASQGAQGIQGIQGPTGAQGPAGGAGAQTRGAVYGGTYPNNETVLPYDINIINVGTGNLFKLPDNAPLGKEIIIDCSATVATIYPFSGGGIETAVNGQSGQRNVSFNDLVKFTSFANNYWLAESLLRNAPLLDGRDLSNGNYWSLSWVSNTTSPLSLSTLNSTWANATTIPGFQVFCPSITGGGLVYTKTGAATWVSQPITVVT